MAHHVFKLVLNNERNATALSDNGLKSPDVGWGTGTWAIDMADKYQSMTIIGVDGSPVQPFGYLVMFNSRSMARQIHGYIQKAPSIVSTPGRWRA